MIKFLQGLLALVFFCVCAESRGDSCPSPENILHRKLSPKYEWTVNEKTTLENLLAVKKLYSVRIMDHGQYVSCHYTTGKWPIKLDMAPEQGECTFVKGEGEWKSTDSGQDVCLEEEPGNCEFTYTCK